jgi:IclR family acetate operon transcriptional repressor
MTDKARDDKPRVQSAARALAVLSAVAASRDGLTAREIAEEVGLNRATAYHLVHTLLGEGFLVSGAQRRLRVGFRVGTLVDGFERQVVSADMVPLARALAAKTSETAYITIRRDTSLVTVCSVPGAHAVGVLPSPLGPIDHGHARASGKLLLALAPADVRERYLDAHPLVRRTDATIVDRAQLDDELDQIRERGYATDGQEYSAGVSCLSVPLAHQTLIGLSLSAPQQRFEEHFDEYLETSLAIAGSPLAPGREVGNLGAASPVAP